ncbi:MAG: hypothetical protein ACRD2I_07615 [Vicinamibacterales bacterium]
MKAPLNIGLTDAARRTNDMPLYTLRRVATGETIQTTDPGRAMVSGKWDDVGTFKGPILRGLTDGYWPSRISCATPRGSIHIGT